MELYIAGGCKEHGRNSFLIERDGASILVDCGIMQGESKPYPKLSKEQIASIKYLFITHSHQDHVGALEWLTCNGFSGKEVLSNKTYNQMKVKPQNPIYLIKSVGDLTLEEELSVSWGQSGHCDGALWFLISWGEKKLFFSGDYCEDSEVYPCDLVRGISADMALLDCAYGYDEVGAAKSRNQVIDKIISYILLKKRSILLPVPKNGRGLEIMKSLIESGQIHVVVGKGLLKQFSCKFPELYIANVARIHEWNSDIEGKKHYAYFVCDPQLKKEENRKRVAKILKGGGKIIFTGNLDKGSYSLELYQSGKARFERYYVHQNLEEAVRLKRKNKFKRVILTHSEESFEEAKLGEEFLMLGCGEVIEV